MMRFAAEAARHMKKAEIIELHHDGKLDAPSGTRRAHGGVDGRRKRSRTAPDPLRALAGTRGASGGHLGQTLAIRHDTISRESFMPGVLLAVRRVASLPEPVIVKLENLLF
jgi:4-hydroxy-tetrahydrodipicolinate reductase